MKKLSLIFVLFAALSMMVTSCDVHEFPELPEKVPFHLRLSYETDMTVWEHLYEDSKVTELGLGETYDNTIGYGKIRYVIRAYPLTDGQRSAQDGVQEFVFTKDIAEGYDHGVTLNLTPGDYDIAVRALSKAETSQPVTPEDAASRVNIDEYKVVFYYVGFMPCA